MKRPVLRTLSEPMYVEGEMVLPRGTEFQGRIIKIAPAKPIITITATITAATIMPI